MPDSNDTLNARDAKLIQWLNEAHAKEAELEADLTAHIGLTQKASYRKRLQDHLKETRDHKRQVERRIKQLGGSVSSGASIAGLSVPGAAAAGEVAGKTVAMLKGQLGAVRAAVTEQVETHLRNAQEELREEHVEIALYTRIEVFATEVGDRETTQLARSIRRDEERMAKFLDAELTRLVKELVRAEIPRNERAGATTTRRRRSSARSTSSSRSTSSRSRTTSRSTGSKTSSRSSSGTRSAGQSRSASGTRSTSKSSSSRNGSSPSTSRARSSSSRSRSTGTRATARARS